MSVPANPIRKSVPTSELERWYACGWAYVMPDFDNAGHSKIEWLSTKAPVEPSTAFPEALQESADERGAARAN